MFDLIFNGKSSKEMAVAVTTRPSIPAPVMRGDWADLGGVDGSLLITDGTYENIEIAVSLNYVCPRDKVSFQYRRLKAWLQGAGELSFSDDYEVFYKVKAAQIADFSRRTRNGADLEAVFICDPYAYYKSGKYTVSKTFPANNTSEKLVLINPGDVARPVIRIGDTPSMLAIDYTLSVNGKSVSGIEDSIVIDTQAMAVYNDTSTPPGLRNSSISGDLENLLLLPGENEIMVTGCAYDLPVTITPNWRVL